MTRKCIICGAPQSVNSTLSFHRFPKKEELRTLWIKSCKLDNQLLLKDALVCSKHFRELDYDNSFWPNRRLLQDAVPQPSHLHARVKVLTPSPQFVNCQMVCTTISEQTEHPQSRESSNINNYYSSMEQPNLQTSESQEEDPLSSIPEHNEFPQSQELSNHSCSSIEEPAPSDPRSNVHNKVRNPRYIGDLEPQDFETPKKAKRNLEMVKNIVDAQRKKIKSLNIQNRRLKKQISLVKDMLAKRDAVDI